MKLKKIMIVDDEAMICQLVKSSLENLWPSLKVEICTDGAAAVQQIQKAAPNLIFLDINMPVVSGSDIAMKLKERHDTKSIPIVFLTGMLTKEEAESHAHRIGGEYFLAKPVSVEELVQTVERFIQ